MRSLKRISGALSGLTALCATQACRTTPSEQPHSYAPASSWGERMAALPRVTATTSPQETIQSHRSLESTPVDSDRDEALRQGFTLLEQGHNQEAHRIARELWSHLDAERVLSLDEDLRVTPYRDVALLMGITESSQGQKARGAQILERLINANPQWEPPYLALASAYSEQGAYQLAERVARSALDRIARGSPALFAARARGLRQQNDIPEAVRVVEWGLRRFPGDAMLLLWRGILENDQEKTLPACEHFALAYNRMPESSAIAHNHALCLSRAGDWDKSLVVLRLSMSRHPRDANLRLLAGNVNSHLGNHVEARKMWNDFLAFAKEDDPRRIKVEADLEGGESEQKSGGDLVAP